jgi:uncharacterized protein YbaR (Trm112 family)
MTLSDKIEEFLKLSKRMSKILVQPTGKLIISGLERGLAKDLIKSNLTYASIPYAEVENGDKILTKATINFKPVDWQLHFKEDKLICPCCKGKLTVVIRKRQSNYFRHSRTSRTTPCIFNSNNLLKIRAEEVGMGLEEFIEARKEKRKLMSEDANAIGNKKAFSCNLDSGVVLKGQVNKWLDNNIDVGMLKSGKIYVTNIGWTDKKIAIQNKLYIFVMKQILDKYDNWFEGFIPVVPFRMSDNLIFSHKFDMVGKDFTEIRSLSYFMSLSGFDEKYWKDYMQNCRKEFIKVNIGDKKQSFTIPVILIKKEK